MLSNDRDEDDDAVGNRDAAYVTWCAAAAVQAGLSPTEIGWVDRTWNAIRPFSTGGNYVNFQSRDDTAARLCDL